MTFVWVNKRDWRSAGPIVNVGVRNAYALAAIGQETHLVVGAGETSDTGTDLATHYGLIIHPQLHVHRVPRRALSASLGWRPHQTSSAPVFRAATRLVQQLLRQAGSVAVLTREASFLPRLAWLKARHGARLLAFYEAHDFHLDLRWRRRHGLPVRSQDVRQALLERLLLAHLDGVICITGEQAQLFQRALPSLRVCTLPLGTTPEPALSAVAVERRRAWRRAVYVGRLSRGKGRDELLAAAPALAQAGVQLAFWGGNPEQAAALARQAEELPLPIEVVPHRTPEALRGALGQEVSVGLAPLADDAYNRYLTCPVKALDYLSHGLPTVATDLPSTREVLGGAGAGAFVPAGDAEALGRAVVHLLDDPVRYAAAADAAQARGEELAWPRRAERLLAFINGE